MNMLLAYAKEHGIPVTRIVASPVEPPDLFLVDAPRRASRSWADEAAVECTVDDAPASRANVNPFIRPTSL